MTRKARWRHAKRSRAPQRKGTGSCEAVAPSDDGSCARVRRFYPKSCGIKQALPRKPCGIGGHLPKRHPAEDGYPNKVGCRILEQKDARCTGDRPKSRIACS